MNVLIVYAHPEPLSLTGSLKNFAVERLTQAGHQVQVSDLYAMKWKAALDADDSLEGPATARFDPSLDSQRAFANGMQSADIAREQQKLRWADAVLLQFPLWWFSMPAILKGWVERVYAYGFAYGVVSIPTPIGVTVTARDAGGKRAMLIVTAGGWSLITPRAASTGRSTISCSRSSTACCTTQASRCCRRSSPTAPAKPMRHALPPCASSSGSGWIICGTPSQSASGGKTPVTI